MVTPKPDLELERWQQQWQTLGGRDDLARTLAERVEQDGRRIRRERSAELLAAAGSVVLCLWLLIHHQGKPVVAVICSCSLLFTGVWVTRLLTLKTAGSEDEGTGLDAFIELTRRRLTQDIAWHTFRRRAFRLLAPLAMALAMWAAFERAERYGAQPSLALVEVGLLIACLLGASVHIRNKLRTLEAARDRFDTLVGDRTLR